jgi:hypothetical protein
MNFFMQFIVLLYSKLLNLYPCRFQDEFAEEMQIVFRDALNEAVEGGMLSLLVVSWRELGNLPASILREFWHEFERKGTNMVTNGKVDPKSTADGGTSHWDALMGALPFALFGIASILSRTRYPFNAYSYLAFYAVILLGLLIGMIKGFPRWAYSYLGWSLVFAWWWTNMGTYGLKIFGFRIYYWTWHIWTPLLATLGITLLWTRSLHPLRQLVRGIWQDWTLLSLAIYAFVAFASLIYDENHHPYLFAFITATTIVVCLAVWGFLKSNSSWKRVVSLLAGFVAALILSNISYLNNMSNATGDYAAYLGLSLSTPQPWYTVFDGIIGWTLFYSVIMYWPVVIGLARRAVNNRKAA